MISETSIVDWAVRDEWAPYGAQRPSRVAAESYGSDVLKMIASDIDPYLIRLQARCAFRFASLALIGIEMAMKPFADVTAASHPARIHAALLHAITEYDRRQARSKSYNRYALPQYMAAIDAALFKVNNEGKTLRQALVASLTDRLLDRCLKAVNEPPSTDAEQRW